MLKIAEYLKGSLEEMRKVSWPTRKETYNYTILVIVISLGLAGFLGAVDYVFSYLLQFFLNN